MFDLQGRTALVTGSTSGIGEVAAEVLAGGRIVNGATLAIDGGRLAT